VIWEPFVLALVLGIIVSAGLYFAYLWPSVEPADDAPAGEAASPRPEAAAAAPPAAAPPAVAGPTDDSASPAP
jgi:hypothetical protein